MLVPPHIEVARRLCGEPIRWADYARFILAQAHESFIDYGSIIGTGPWYVTSNEFDFSFTMTPFEVHYHTFNVRPSEDSECWIFEVIP